MKSCDALFVGYAVNSTSGGYTNPKVRYIDTVGIKYLYSHFYGTYCAEPLAFLQLAAQMRAEALHVEILDGLLLGYTREEIKSELLKYDSKVFCFSLYESSRSDVVDLMMFVKQLWPNAKIITGGPYVTLCYKELLETTPVVDYVVIGDGDIAMPALVKAILSEADVSEIPGVVFRDKNGQACSKVCPKAIDMDELTQPARDFANIIREKGYSMSMSTSRGCGHAACSFCYLPLYQRNGMQPRYRVRSPQLVVDEIEELILKYNIRKLTFVDDDFFGPDDTGIIRARRIFDLLIERQIRIELYINARVSSIQKLIEMDLIGLASRAGVKYFFIGFESYNDDILKKYNKGITIKEIDHICDVLHLYGISINPGMITFDRSINIEQVKNNVDLLKKIDYYDMFMFTRTLMILPNINKKMKDNSVTIGYFENIKTEKLYNALAWFRDLLYSFVADLPKETFEETVRRKIVMLHYDFFYAVYDVFAREDAYNSQQIIEKYVKQYMEKIKAIVEKRVNELESVI